MNIKNRLGEYIKQSIADLTVLGFAILILFFSRLGLVVCFYKAIKDWPSWQEWFAVFGRGFWFDAQIAAYGIIPLMGVSLISGLFPAFGSMGWRIRQGYRWVLFAGLISYCAANLTFFHEYHESFNSWVFQIFYEDWRAILETAWVTYPIVWGLCGIAALVCVLAWLSEGVFRRVAELKLSRMSFLGLLVCVVFIVAAEGIALRGSYHSRPLKRRDAAMTEHAFLTKIVGNPFHTLKWAYVDARDMGLFRNVHIPLAESVLEQMAQSLWGVSWEGEQTYLKQTQCQAKGPKVAVKPKHVFLIVMESQNNWPMIPPYEVLGMNPELRHFGNEGYWAKSFLPADVGTVHALCSIMTGLHHAGFFPNFQKSSRSAYVTALAPVAKRLGYEHVLFFDAGYINWQRMDIFGRDQGFDEVLGAVSGGCDSRTEGRVWGLTDETLFANVLDKVDPDKPSFNLIMTITNHPPFMLTEAQLEAEGCLIKDCPDGLSDLNDDSVPMRIHAHTWYGDHCVGNFIREAEERFGPALFIITGDHWSRQFLNQQPELYERTSVPFILYGPEVLEGVVYPEYTAGDHVDITPTIVELIAPEGFIYHTHGKDLLAKEASNPVGFGASTIITPDFIFDNKEGPLTRLPWAREDAVEPDQKGLRERYQALKWLSQWVVFEKERTSPVLVDEVNGVLP